MTTICVFLCDDVPELRVLVRLAFEDAPDLEVIGEAGDATSALEAVERLRPDVLLLDLSLPGLDGLEALPQFRERAPETAVIVFSGFAAARMEHLTLAAGAARYVEKGAPFPELIEAIREVAQRER